MAEFSAVVALGCEDEHGGDEGLVCGGEEGGVFGDEAEFFGMVEEGAEEVAFLIGGEGELVELGEGEVGGGEDFAGAVEDAVGVVGCGDADEGGGGGTFHLDGDGGPVGHGWAFVRGWEKGGDAA